MFPPIFATLKLSQAVKDIVGSNPPRIYRHGSAPQPASGQIPSEPYITWIMFGVPENQLSGTPPVDRQTVQVDYWHPTDRGVVELATAGRDALEPFAHMTSQRIDERERETKLFHISQDFDWFVDR